MEVSLAWTYIDDLTLQSNVFFSTCYYKITRIKHKQVYKYRLEFCDHNFCSKSTLTLPNLDEARYTALQHATLLVYDFAGHDNKSISQHIN